MRPDGQFVGNARLGASSVRGPSYDTYFIKTADGVRQMLCEDCGAMSDWSPSGSLVVGMGRSAATRALEGRQSGTTLTNLETRQSRVVFSGYGGDPRFSPDEQWLASHGRTNEVLGIRQVFIARIPASGESAKRLWIPVTDGSSNSFRAGWSPDGNLLFYGSERDGYGCIYAQPLDPNTKRPSGPVREVYHSHGIRRSMAIQNPGPFGLSVAQDKIAFTMAELTGDIWIMEPRDAK